MFSLQIGLFKTKKDLRTCFNYWWKKNIELFKNECSLTVQRINGKFSLKINAYSKRTFNKLGLVS